MNRSEKDREVPYEEVNWLYVFLIFLWILFQFLVPTYICLWAWVQKDLDFFFGEESIIKLVSLIVAWFFIWFFTAFFSILALQKVLPRFFGTSEEEKLRRQREEEKKKRQEKIRRQIWLMRRKEAGSRLFELVRSAQEEPELASLFRRLQGRASTASPEKVEQALNNAGLVLAGIGLWLEEFGIPNSFPGHLLAGIIKNEIAKGFAGSSSEERRALGIFLPQLVRVAEEALSIGFTDREILEVIVPIFLQA